LHRPFYTVARALSSKVVPVRQGRPCQRGDGHPAARLPGSVENEVSAGHTLLRSLTRPRVSRWGGGCESRPEDGPWSPKKFGRAVERQAGDGVWSGRRGAVSMGRGVERQVCDRVWTGRCGMGFGAGSG
jgi:hypothetical protein